MQALPAARVPGARQGRRERAGRGIGACTDAGRWALTFLAAGAGGWLADRLGLAGGWLVGAMAVGAAVSLSVDRAPEVGEPLQRLALAVIGVGLAGTVDRGTFAALGRLAAPLAVHIAALLGLSVGAGLALARLAGTTRATGVLALIPGAASSMVAVSAEVGADPRLVATVQYVRLIVVALSAPGLVGLAGWMGAWGGVGGGPPPAVAPEVEAVAPPAAGGGPAGLVGPAVTWGAVVAGVALGRRLPVPAGPMLVPMGTLLAAALVGVPHAPVPPEGFRAGLVLLGLWVGLQFDRACLRQVGRVAAWACVLSLALVGAGVWLGLLLHGWTGLPLQASLLGTTPGAIETMTAVALQLSAQPALVLAMQLVRMLAAAGLGPWVVRWIHARDARRPSTG